MPHGPQQNLGRSDRGRRASLCSAVLANFVSVLTSPSRLDPHTSLNQQLHYVCNIQFLPAFNAKHIHPVVMDRALDLNRTPYYVGSGPGGVPSCCGYSHNELLEPFLDLLDSNLAGKRWAAW